MQGNFIFYDGGWSFLAEGKTFPAGAKIICDGNDPGFMSKVNQALGRKIYSDEQIKEHKVMLEESGGERL